jgi:hypothetical protein
MARAEKLLDAEDPRDRRIEDVKTLCAVFGLYFDRPPGGSHYGISDATKCGT